MSNTMMWCFVQLGAGERQTCLGLHYLQGSANRARVAPGQAPLRLKAVVAYKFCRKGGTTSLHSASD